ncbi:MAG: DNA mismatch repair protein MutS [Euryarchaeota archaeon RBG_16_62_10]|nr:MAG: DNA mismatch repair protein MutS [Euryarchaeota archaeon RBG_16_62_10]
MAKATTPLMEQYFRIKEKHRDCLLLFRLGDFYEMFGEDAVIGSKELEITLTSRDKGKKERIPLCGVPWHALDSYLPKLLTKGYKVAICEQLQDPRHAKGLVDRDVVRIVTPGTVLESTVLDSKSNNYLMAIARSDRGFGLSFVDISTGEFSVTQVEGEGAEAKALAEFAQRSPSEVLHQKGLADDRLIAEFAQSGAALTELDDVAFIEESSESLLRRHFKVQTLEGLGLADKPLAVSSAGAAMRYLESTQMRSVDFLSRPRFFSTSDKLVLDQTTLRNLEVLRNVRDGGPENTLVSVLDRTRTPMGARLLRKWLTEPLMDVKEIDRRLDAVAEMVSRTAARSVIADALGGVRDLERLVGKAIYGSANGRDLVAIRACLERLPELKEVLASLGSELLRGVANDIGEMSDIACMIARSIVDDPPVGVKDGGLIKDGFDPEVDALRRSSKEDQDWIAGLEQKERKRTGIKNLRLGFNNVFGYYIEVSKSFVKQVPPDYERKQTIAGGERYVTPELKERERSVLSAQERACALEYDAFVRVREEVARHGEGIRSAARAIAVLDVLDSFADVAVSNRYSRPEVNESDTIIVKDGRHPVVERALRSSFVPNDAFLDINLNRLVILTGPNMAGKSTYLRQIAAIVIMAQAGSFVPASEAKIGLVDRVFTRVGAFDDLSRGQSTFMVEMTELANILNSSTKRSLILLDEIGRGTSTFDGLAIAWAVSEHLYDRSKVGAKTLFATHYHQLTELAESLDGVKNYAMAVKEQGSEVIFLRKVVPGRANKSYGIQVARLAGVPHAVVSRAEQVLSRIEEENVLEVKAGKKVHRQELLVTPANELAVEEELRRLDLSRLTPMEAYVKLNELKKRLGGSGGR